jgi:hypothetical protein
VLGTPDSALDAVLVHIFENLSERGRQIEEMKAESLGSYQGRFRAHLPPHWPKFDVLPVVGAALGSHPVHEFKRFTILIPQGLTMVRERQRHQPLSGYPTLDFAERNSIL